MPLTRESNGFVCRSFWVLCFENRKWKVFDVNQYSFHLRRNSRLGFQLKLSASGKVGLKNASSHNQLSQPKITSK